MMTNRCLINCCTLTKYWSMCTLPKYRSRPCFKLSLNNLNRSSSLRPTFSLRSSPLPIQSLNIYCSTYGCCHWICGMWTLISHIRIKINWDKTAAPQKIWSAKFEILPTHTTPSLTPNFPPMTFSFRSATSNHLSIITIIFFNWCF